jgi:hypothetical protein
VKDSGSCVTTNASTASSAFALGIILGLAFPPAEEGCSLGNSGRSFEGATVGLVVLVLLGLSDGDLDSCFVGSNVGTEVEGDSDALMEGVIELKGESEGAREGFKLGLSEGFVEGIVIILDGCVEGTSGGT